MSIVKGKDASFPLVADYRNLKERYLPMDWAERACAVRAARADEFSAIYMGYIPITIGEISAGTVSTLSRKHKVTAPGITNSIINLRGGISRLIPLGFNIHGEFPSNKSFISMWGVRKLFSTSWRWSYISPESESDDENFSFDLGEDNDEGQSSMANSSKPKNLPKPPTWSDMDKNLTDKIVSLQNPSSSPWGLPLIRCCARYQHDEKNNILHLQAHLYFTRLVFELISDESIKLIMSHMQGVPVRVLRHTPTRHSYQNISTTSTTNSAATSTSSSNSASSRYTPMFTTPSRDLLKQASQEYQYSLAGVMNLAESSGYPYTISQPPRLSPPLYKYQLSTIQWMLDQERDPVGLNGHLWDRYFFSEITHGSDLYYLPLAGEFRFSMPPHVTGGLLCEEMGLGKTIEMIALILLNPFQTLPTTTTTSASSASTSTATARASVSMLSAHAEPDPEPVADVKEGGRAGGVEGLVGVEDVQEEGSSRSTRKRKPNTKYLTEVNSNKKQRGGDSAVRGKQGNDGGCNNDVDDSVVYHTQPRKKILSASKDSNGLGLELVDDDDEDDGLSTRFAHDEGDENEDTATGLNNLVKATLVVVPTSLLSQWTRELLFKAEGLDVFVVQDSFLNKYGFIVDEESILSSVPQSSSTSGQTKPITGDDFGGLNNKASVSVASTEDTTEKRSNVSNKEYINGRKHLMEVLKSLPKYGNKGSIQFPLESAHGLETRNIDGKIVRTVPFQLDKPSKSGIAPDYNRIFHKYRVQYAVQLDFDKIFRKHDVVVATYHTIVSHPLVFSRYKWHRIILDECQEVKSNSSKVASICANKLQSSHRWMSSGTPLCKSIDDLHGELQFLHIWPFSLSNRVDGFWDLKVKTPFSYYEKESLDLLRSLFDVVMMRHTKLQSCIDTNLPILPLPRRVIEWRSVKLQTASEIYLHNYIAEFCAETFLKLETNALRVMDDDTNDSDFETNFRRAPDFKYLKTLLTLMSRFLSHAGCVQLSQFDYLRRMLSGAWQSRNQIGHNGTGDGMGNLDLMPEVHQFPKVTPEEALAIVQAVGAGVFRGQGLNHDTHRQLANVREYESRAAFEESLDSLSLEDLKAMLERKKLPMPSTWQKTQLLGTISIESNQLYVSMDTGIDLSPVRNSSSTEKPVNQNTPDTDLTSRIMLQDFKPQDKLQLRGRVTGDRSELFAGNGAGVMVEEEDVGETENRRRKKTWATFSAEVASVHMPSEEVEARGGAGESVQTVSSGHDEPHYLKLTERWTNESIANYALYKQVSSTRRQPYIDLLTTDYFQNEMTNSSVHEQGFTSIYSIMAGQQMTCPLCLEFIDRPALTTCVHLYCLGCIVSIFHNESTPEAEGQSSTKCPVCRRLLKTSDIMEIVLGSNQKSEEVDTQTADMTNGVATKKQKTWEASGSQSNGSSRDVIDLTGAYDYGVAMSSSTSRTTITRPTTTSTTTTSTAATSASASSAADTSKSSSNSYDVFLVPPLHGDSSAPTAEDVRNSEAPTRVVSSRDPALPSIAQLPLSHFREWAVDTHPQSRRSTQSLVRNQGTVPVSSRFQALLTDMIEQLNKDPTAKFVIFSQHTDVLRILRRVFDSHPLFGEDSYVVIERSTRQNFDDFHNTPQCRICMLTVGWACAGLTLTEASVCYILEPLANAADEAQAMSRIHRIGQTKDTRCVVFFMADSWEERLLAHRQRNHRLTELLSGEMDGGHNEHDKEGNDKEERENDSSWQMKKRNRQSSSVGGSAAGKTKTVLDVSANELRMLFGINPQRLLLSNLN